MSSTESEYWSLAHGVQQALWTRSWLNEIDLGLEDEPLKLLCDSIGAISLSETTKEHEVSKHVDIKLHFICDVVASGAVEIFPVASTQNVADIMTKALSRPTHHQWVIFLRLPSGPGGVLE